MTAISHLNAARILYGFLTLAFLTVCVAAGVVMIRDRNAPDRWHREGEWRE